MGQGNSGDTFKVGAVALACIGLVAVMTIQVFHNGFDLAVMGPVILFLGYLVSEAWTPLPELSPAIFWSIAIIFTTVVEVVFLFVQ